MSIMIRITLAVLALVVPVVAQAQAMTINAPGTYVLDSDKSDPQTVVQINASNVVLQLNGKTLTCNPQSGQTATTNGIAAGNLHHVRIQGPGNIRNCYKAIELGYGSDHVVDGVDVSLNRYIGINAPFGYGNIIRDIDCELIGGFYASGYAICINGVGVNSRVENVRIHEMYKQSISPEIGEGIGILVEWGATGVVFADIQMTNKVVQPNTIGVWVAGTSSVVANAVTITGFTDPHRGEGTYTVGTPPTPPPQGGDTIPWHVCFGTPQVCYSGTLTKVTGQ